MDLGFIIPSEVSPTERGKHYTFHSPRGIEEGDGRGRKEGRALVEKEIRAVLLEGREKEELAEGTQSQLQDRPTLGV